MPNEDKNETINIIRPDGSVTSGTRAELERLKRIGDYREESTFDKRFREAESATKRLYSTTSDKIGAVVEGGLSGITLGASDLVLNTDESDLRAKYNPNHRLGGELVGGIVGSALIPGSPAGLLTRGAESAAIKVGGVASKEAMAAAELAGKSVAEVTRAGVKGAGIKGALTAGGIEGAGFGIQAEISNAELTNTPITGEAIVAGMGMGTLFGAGIAGGLHGIGKAVGKVGDKLAPPPVKTATKLESLVEQPHYDAFRTNIKDTTALRGDIENTINILDEQIAAETGAYEQTLNNFTRQNRELKVQFDDLNRQTLNHDTLIRQTEQALNKAEGEAEDYLKQYRKANEWARNVTLKDKASGGLLAPYDDISKSFTKMRDRIATSIDANPEANEAAKRVALSDKEFRIALKEMDYTEAKDALGRFREAVVDFKKYGAEPVSDVERKFNTLFPDAPEPRITKDNKEYVWDRFSGQHVDENGLNTAGKKVHGPDEIHTVLADAQAQFDAAQKLKPANDLTTAEASLLKQYEGVLKSKKSLESTRQAIAPNLKPDEFKAHLEGEIAKLKAKSDIAPYKAAMKQLADTLGVEPNQVMQEMTRLRNKASSKDIYDKGVAELAKGKKKSRAFKDVDIPEINKSIREPKIANLWDQYDTKIKNLQDKLNDLKVNHPVVKREAVATALESSKTAHIDAKLSKPDFTAVREQQAKLTEIKKALDTLHNIPLKASQFTNMQTATADKLFNSLDLVMKSDLPELGPIKQSIEAAVNKLVEDIGIKAEGSVVDTLRGIKKLAHAVDSQKIAKTVESMAEAERRRYSLVDGVPDWALAAPISHFTGMPYFPLRGLMATAEGLSGISRGVRSRISNAAKRASQGLTSPRKNVLAAMTYPLYTKLDGSREEKVDYKTAATRRIQEVSDALVAANDVFYKSVEPLVGTQADAALAIHKAAVSVLNMLYEDLPKPQENVVINFQSTFKASGIEALTTAKLWKAAMAPITVFEDAIMGHVDPIAITAVQKYYPELYNLIRSEILQQVEFTKLSYKEAEMFSTLINIAVSTFFSPENIVDAQAQFAATPSPQLPQMDRGGGRKNNGGGRPTKMEPPTPAQVITDKMNSYWR